MKVVKKFFDVTPDMRDGFGQQRQWLRDEKCSRHGMNMLLG